MNNKQIIQERAVINNIDLRRKITNIKAPTLVLVGTDFGRFAIKMSKEIAEHIRGAKFLIIKGGCDPSNLTATDKFDKKVIDFVKNNKE